MARFVCKNCNYRFDSERAFECPYCGREDMFEKEKSAVELLEEIDRILKE